MNVLQRNSLRRIHHARTGFSLVPSDRMIHVIDELNDVGKILMKQAARIHKLEKDGKRFMEKSDLKMLGKLFEEVYDAAEAAQAMTSGR